MKEILVSLKNSPYSIFLNAPLQRLGGFMRKVGFRRGYSPTKALIVTHPFLKGRYGTILQKSLSSAEIQTSFALVPPGEKHKNLKTVQTLYERCLESKLDRSSCILTFGGGVIGDTAGFVAATYLRGISLIHVPTTLLAMVDSSIGGKVGVDLPGSKNSVGSFYQPKLVWTDPQTLETLPNREFRNGLAEIIKCGVIKDAHLFQVLEKCVPNIKSQLNAVIAICAQIKARVVTQDEKETHGVREILNFGHTIGHAIETATGYSDYKHGEAIAMGMCAAGEIACDLNLWKRSDQSRLKNIILRSGLPIRLRKTIPSRKLLSLLYRDKKSVSGQIRFVLPTRIGQVQLKTISASSALKGIRSIQP
ncbi:MAG: 3-dehydroquinate synthase [Elusimicrobia bacterium]|nr:3-dehydroquinate synthase [Elusimicrobiota bacterium]